MGSEPRREAEEVPFFYRISRKKSTLGLLKREVMTYRPILRDNRHFYRRVHSV